jgi:hypothetical protein
MPKTFVPLPHATNWLLTIALLSIGYAIYFRYQIVERAEVGLACDGGLATWTCLSRKIMVPLFENSAFGWVALIAAVLTLIRPNTPLMAVAVAATGLGLVLHNGGLAGLAGGLLILSLARPAPETEPD